MKHRAWLLLMLGMGAQAQVPAPIPADPVPLHRELSASPQCAGRRVLLPVVTEGLERRDGGVLYRMNFNQVTEGWNWHPEAAAEDRDYYQYKFLPLTSVDEARSGYRGEDKIGEPQDFRVQWRYDYFFAFDNLYDFFPRRVDDDAGFSAPLAEDIAPEHLGMAAEVSLRAPCVAESSTFWKATHARPVDFMLKKRYLMGELEAVVFYDRRTQAPLGRIEKSALAGRR